MTWIRANRRLLARAAGVCIWFAGCRHAPALGSQAIPLPDRAPWNVVLGDSSFSIAMDTSHLKRGPDNGWIVWYVTTHARPLGPDSMRFDRGRISLLVRCDPPAFKSMSQELALGDAPPVSHQRWQLSGPNAVHWRVPTPGTTDAEFLRATCIFLRTRRGAA